MATYDNNLRIKEIATGAEAGTWGASTNTNLELIGEALGYSTQNCFASDADATTTVADGSTDPARAMYLKVTSSATLTATRTLTFAPATMSRVMFIENATTGSQSITIAQGSGTTVTIGSGAVKAIYLDGGGAGANVGEFSTGDLTAVTTDILPNTDDNNDLGSASKRWQDLYLSGGVYLGGTTSANYLSDYEEGTIVFPGSGPLETALSGTVSAYYAEYVKIGRVVHVYGKLTGSSLKINAGTSPGYLIYGALPFVTTNAGGGGGVSSRDNFTGVVGDGASYGIANPLSEVASVAKATASEWAWGSTEFTSSIITSSIVYHTDS